MVHQDQNKSQCSRLKLLMRWFCLPRFWTGAFISFTTLFAFIFWIRIDAFYPSAVHSIQLDLGVQPIEADPYVVEIGFWDEMWDEAKQWENLGWRRFLFGGLACLAFLSSAIAVIRLYFTRDQKRFPPSQCGVAVALVLLWVGLWYFYAELEWWSIQQRVKKVLPRFELAAKSLQEDWPEKGETVPELGTVGSVEQYPDVLLLREWNTGNGYPLQEGFGAAVEKSGDGILRFALNSAAGEELEKHPRGSSPRAYTKPFGPRYAIARSASLGDSWYLVRLAKVEK